MKRRARLRSSSATTSQPKQRRSSENVNSFTDPSFYRRFFPLRCLSDALSLLKSCIGSPREHNLAFLSLAFGYIQFQCTCGEPKTQKGRETILSSVQSLKQDIFYIEFSKVLLLYTQFEAFLNVKILPHRPTGAEANSTGAGTPEETVLLIGRRIWEGLLATKNYDKPHLQTLFSFTVGSQLDQVGLAHAVVAASQLLGYSDVHLVVAEDHAWVSYGQGGDNHAQVTWHGKNQNDLSGKPLPASSRKWLYSDGHAVKCRDRETEVAVLISSLNAGLSSTEESYSLTVTMWVLLRYLRSAGVLQKYPPGMTKLAELHESLTCLTLSVQQSLIPSGECPPQQSILSSGDFPDVPLEESLLKRETGVTTERLFTEAVKASRSRCDGALVFPILGLAAYYYRRGVYTRCLQAIAALGITLQRYSYQRTEDTELSREISDFTQEKLHLITSHESVKLSPLSFKHILQLYDGICCWEEGSESALVHVGWARVFNSSIKEFPYSVRGQLAIQPFSSSTSDHGTILAPVKERSKTPEITHKQGKGASTTRTARSTRSLPRGRAAEAAADSSTDSDSDESSSNRPVLTQSLTVYSRKFAGLCGALVDEKLGISTIELHLTASVGSLGKKVRRSGAGSSAKYSDFVLAPSVVTSMPHKVIK